MTCSNHSWVSFQGFSESYNDAFKLAIDKGEESTFTVHLKKIPLFIELSPRIVSEAFYNGELENELRRINMVDYRFKKDSDREECMGIIEEIRRGKLYHHVVDMCADECKQRGNLTFVGQHVCSISVSPILQGVGICG